ERQRRDPNSLLNRVERMIRLRKEHPEFGLGEWAVVDTGIPSIFAVRASWKNSTMVAVHNLSRRKCTVSLPLPDDESRHLVDALKGDSIDAPEEGPCQVELEGYGVRWLRVAK
ncbi:MAG TPA: trehalose synthase, partial [Chloroflexota bacterium]|nr:trehalose synthase [Chloroflexota bacterium]